MFHDDHRLQIVITQIQGLKSSQDNGVANWTTKYELAYIQSILNHFYGDTQQQ